MEELDFKELFSIFWSKKVQIILIILIFAVLGAIYTMTLVKPKYTSSTTLVLVQAESNKGNTVTTESITTTDITLNSKLVSTYSELIKSKNVLRQVMSNLNLDLNEEEIKKNIKVKSVSDTALIEISVTDENPKYAEKLTNEIANVFVQKVSEIYNINNVYIVDKAEFPTEPSNINHLKDIIIFAFAGIFFAFVSVFIINLLDTTVKNSEDIEKKLGISVLASIPKYDSK